jgi:hypothetical protein
MVSGQLHKLAAPQLQEKYPAPFEYAMGRRLEFFWTRWKREKSVPLSEINLSREACGWSLY